MKNNLTETPIIAQIQPECDSFCRIVKEAKKAQGKTNQDIADVTGIPLSHLSKYLSGNITNPNLYNAAAVCIYLGISLDEIFGLQPRQANDPGQAAELQARVRELERELEYCRQDRDNLLDALRSRKLIITVLLGVCILLIVSISFGVIYDSVLPTEGFIHGSHLARISVILITVIVIAIAVTVLIMGSYLYKKEKKQTNDL